MVSYGFALLLTATIFFGSSYATNYCDSSLCRRGPHVACNAPTQFGPACGDNAKYVQMDSKMKNLILNKHNQLRAEIAQGQHGFPPAVRMPTLVWDDELANIASFNARKCVFAHDKCRSTREFKYAGQNLAITSFFGYDFKASDRAENFTQEWFNEHKDCPKSYVDAYPSSHRGPQIGHFTQLVNDRAWKVGCSMMHYITKRGGKTINYYLVCNYTMTNMIGEPIYTKGPTGSKCKTGQNPQFRGLCTTREQIKSESYNG